MGKEPDLMKHVDSIEVDVPHWIDITDWESYSAWIEGAFKTEEEFKEWKRNRRTE